MRDRVNIEDGEPIGVYKITTPFGRVYVGMTCDSFQRRWNGHSKDLRRDVHKCSGLQNSYGKYGWDQLQFKILEQWDKPPDRSKLLALEKKVLIREQWWWDKFSHDGISMLHGRPTGTGGFIHTEASRQKLSRTLRNKAFDKSKIDYPNANLKIGEHSIEIELTRKKLDCDKAFWRRVNSSMLYCCVAHGRENSPTRYPIDFSYEELYEMYWVQKMSRIQIARAYGVTHSKIERAMLRLKNPARNTSETTINFASTRP